MNSEQVRCGILYVVATPIGNLDDISERAREVLKAVDLIAAEDTRHTAHLLDHFGISTRRVSLHEHNETARSTELIRRLLEGESIALVSDAGTPLISDPGSRLVSQAHEQEIQVVPVPGPSALTTALSVCGLDLRRVCFEGFPPASKGQRSALFESLAGEMRTLVFYESPHRILNSMQDMAHAFGEDREAVVCRELTKRYETVRRGRLVELLEWMRADDNQQRGEFVVVVEGAREVSEIKPEWLDAVKVLNQHLPTKQAAKLVSDLTGASRQVLYRAALED